MAPAGRDDVDIDSLISDFKGKVSDDSLVMPTGICIFKIPTILFRHNEKAYSPNAFSIGPFHYNKDDLKPAERIKWNYFSGLISRLQPPSLDSTLRTLTEAICSVRKQAREHYAGPIDMTADEFVKVLVFDGCFIIELFRKKAYKDNFNQNQNDPVFAMSCLLQFLYHDLILLENQIPWLVLDTLFKLTTTAIDKKPLVQLAIEFFHNIFSSEPPQFHSLLSNPHGNKHILDLLRNSLVLSSPIPQNRNLGWQPMPSATSLKEAGITFKKSTSKCLLDIKFHDEGVLEIPLLFIQETTETLFRNLISLEQCCPNYEPIFTSYAVILDNLINTNADMDILCKSDVIHNWLNIEDATRFFNKLYDDTYVKENYYLTVTSQVNSYCQRRWPRYRTVLMHDYFKHPWALLSVIAAAIILILTFLQTVFGIIKK